MEVMEFCRGIELEEEAVRVVESQMHLISEEEYQRGKDWFWKDRDAFERMTGEREDMEESFLMYYCRFACDTYGIYEEKGIPEKVFWDTFADIRYWCMNCQNEYGRYGIHEYAWFRGHFDLRIFRLGRLQYELPPSGKGPINVHIPQGEPLHWEACDASVREAFRWFGEKQRYVCHSWLLFPGLKKLLPETSNIILFQNHFQVEKVDYDNREAEWRIFGKVLEDLAAYPEETFLQRAAKQYLLQGEKLGNGFGSLKL